MSWVLPVFLAVAGVLALWRMHAIRGREVEISRVRENLHRFNLARKVGNDFYSYEDEDGSLHWRRVSAG